MKKSSILLLVAMMIASISSVTVNAAGLVFTDNFASGNFSKWTNLAIEKGDKADTECAGKATIANSTLTIKNFDPVGSFFYLSPKNIKTKNFTVSMKVKSNSLHDGWIGFSVRKETNDRYNGSNNVLFTYRLNSEGSWLGALRGYSGSITSLDTKVTDKATFTGDLTQYHVFKLVVKDTTYTAYIDDMKLGTLVYDKLLINTAGYMSINACLADIAIKDFSLQTEDGVVVTPPTSSVVSSSVVSSTVGGTSSTAGNSSKATSNVNNSSNSTIATSNSTGNSDVQNSTDTSMSTDSTEVSSDVESVVSESSETSNTESNSQNSDGTTTGGFPTIPVIIAAAAVLLIGGGLFAYLKFVKK